MSHPVRLTNSEIEAVKSLAAKWFGKKAIVRLFGSRARDGALGGDIDLHILAEADELVDLQRELAFSVELQEIIGEQKLDVVVRAPNEPRMPIDRVAMENGVLL